jgi:hypothetical protein
MCTEEYKAICIITGKAFSEPEAGNEISETNMGPVWMGLWEDSDKIQFDAYGFALIPRDWLHRYKALDGVPEEYLEK